MPSNELTLLEKQKVFARLIAELILDAYSIGYEVKFGEALRSKEEAERLYKKGKGIKSSLHCSSLAIDLLLFRDGAYLRRTEDYRQLGMFWEAKSTGKPYKCHWGGHFNDGNHFSIGHYGRK